MTLSDREVKSVGEVTFGGGHPLFFGGDGAKSAYVEVSDGLVWVTNAKHKIPSTMTYL